METNPTPLDRAEAMYIETLANLGKNHRDALQYAIDAYNLAAPSPVPGAPCEWKDDGEDNWQTGCGHDFAVTGGKPTEEEWKHCHCCGKPIAIEPKEDPQ